MKRIAAGIFMLTLALPGLAQTEKLPGIKKLDVTSSLSFVYTLL